MADVVSIYADYTCYFHIRRLDSGNAGYPQILTGGPTSTIWQSLSRSWWHTPSQGRERNRIFRRWLQVEMVQRLTGRRRAQLATKRQLRYSATHIGSRPATSTKVSSSYCNPCHNVVARAIIAGDAEEVRRITAEMRMWKAYPSMLAGGLGRRPPSVQRNGPAVRCHAPWARCLPLRPRATRARCRR